MKQVNLYYLGGGSVTPDEVYLYKDNDECVDITGGWQAVAKAVTNKTPPAGVNGTSYLSTPTKTVTDNYMQAYLSSATRQGSLMTVNPIDLTAYSKLNVVGCFYGSALVGSAIYVATNNGYSAITTTNSYYERTSGGWTADPITVTLDISNINILAYIAIYVGTNYSGYSVSCRVYRMWLEK